MTATSHDIVRGAGPRGWYRAAAGIKSISMNKIIHPQTEFSEKFLNRFISQSRDLILVTDRHRRITYVNQAVCEKTGYSAEDLEGLKISVLYPKANRARYTSVVLQRLQKKRYRAGEMQFCTKNGSVFWVDLILYPMAMGNHSSSGVLYHARDVTERHLLDQFRLASENHLQRVMESIDDAMAVCDRAGTILLCNQAHCRMLGYQRDEIVGARPPYLWVDPMDRAKLHSGVKDLFKKGNLKNYTFVWHRRDRSTLVVSAVFSLLRDADGAVTGYVVTSRDITDVQYVDELRRTNDRMQRFFTDVQRKAERLQTLEGVNSLVLNGANLTRIFASVIRGLKKLVHHDLAGVYMYDTGHTSLHAYTVSKKTPFSRELSKCPQVPGEGIIGKAAVSGKLVMINNAQRDPRSRYPENMKPDLEHFIAVPLKGRDSIFGVLVVARNSDPEFLEEEAMIIKSFADVTSVALENARMSLELDKIHRALSKSSPGTGARIFTPPLDSAGVEGEKLVGRTDRKIAGS